MYEAKEIYKDWWEESDFNTKLDIEYRPALGTLYRMRDFGVIVTGRTEDGVLKYFYGGIKTPYQFNNDILYCQELVWCVSKNESSLKNLNAFMECIDYTLREHGVDLYSLVLPEIYRSKQKDMFFKRKEFHPVDTVFFKRISHG